MTPLKTKLVAALAKCSLRLHFVRPSPVAPRELRPREVVAAIRAYLNLPVGTPLTSIPGLLQVNGASVEPSSLIAALTAINTQGVLADSVNFQTTAGATLTLSNLVNLTQRITTGGACTVTIDSAYNIVNNIANPFLGQSFPFLLVGNAATTVATPTLLDSTVTLAGTTSLVAASVRYYQGLITQLSTTTGATVTAGTTFTSLAQVGTSNTYTVTLATNTITPVVGTAILINVTAGTLPSGWYPIVKVTSATSFVIAAPIAGVAWTATAATIPGTATVPVASYSAGLSGLYSPLVTITGMWSTATNTTAV